jgi:hypothetical protein
MLKITVDISKHEGTRLSRFENVTDEDAEPTPTETKDNTGDTGIPRNDEVSEERMYVTRVNWLGRRERTIPKKETPIAPGGTTKNLGDDDNGDEDGSDKEKKDVGNGKDTTQSKRSKRAVVNKNQAD